MTHARRVVDRHYGVTQVLVAAAGIQLYELLRHATTPNWATAERHALEIVRWERGLHIGWEQTLQVTFLKVPDVVRAMNVFYVVGHFVLTALFFLWLYHTNRDRFRRFRNGFLAATFIALLVHWGFPTAPPRLAGVGLVDTLRQLSNIDIGSPASASFSNPVAAVPSLHAGWAVGVGVGLLLFARPLLWRVAGVLYPLAVVVTILVTGNHFLFDAVAGIAVMALGFWLSEALRGRPGATIAAATRGGAVR